MRSSPRREIRAKIIGEIADVVLGRNGDALRPRPSAISSRRASTGRDWPHVPAHVQKARASFAGRQCAASAHLVDRPSCTPADGSRRPAPSPSPTDRRRAFVPHTRTQDPASTQRPEGKAGAAASEPPLFGASSWWNRPRRSGRRADAAIRAGIPLDADEPAPEGDRATAPVRVPSRNARGRSTHVAQAAVVGEENAVSEARLGLLRSGGASRTDGFPATCFGRPQIGRASRVRACGWFVV